MENDFVPVDDEALPGDDEGPTGSPNPTATTTTTVARRATAVLVVAVGFGEPVGPSSSPGSAEEETGTKSFSK